MEETPEEPRTDAPEITYIKEEFEEKIVEQPVEIVKPTESVIMKPKRKAKTKAVQKPVEE